MTVMDTRHVEAGSGIAPLPELETVPAGDDVTLVGALSDSDTEIDDSLAIELEFLTALVWAPHDITRQVVTALVGATGSERQESIPRSANLLWQPRHQAVFQVIVELVDEAVPPTPMLVQARIAEAGQLPRLRNVVLELAAPRGRGPLPGGSDVPYLAAAVADAWYRRGYRALRKRLQQAEDERPTAELAGHWAALTSHQQTAERRWLAVRDNLAKI